MLTSLDGCSRGTYPVGSRFIPGDVESFLLTDVRFGYVAEWQPVGLLQAFDE
jgi:hypothetical protein